jgi:hypothetical protein
LERWECYGLSSGGVFSEDGQSSRQIDIVIYDTIFANVLFRDSANSLFPCEAVFGNIEVKSALTTAELETAIDNVASLKSLPRRSSDIFDLLPYRRLNFGDEFSYEKTRKNPYLGIIFAYDGLIAKTVTTQLNERLRMTDDKQSLPDFLFNYKRQYMVSGAIMHEGERRLVPIGHDFDQFVVANVGTDILPLFYLTVNSCLNGIMLCGPDFHKYWWNTLRAALNPLE